MNAVNVSEIQNTKLIFMLRMIEKREPFSFFVCLLFIYKCTGKKTQNKIKIVFLSSVDVDNGMLGCYSRSSRHRNWGYLQVNRSKGSKRDIKADVLFYF